MATAESNEFDSLFMIPNIDETPPTLEEILKDEDDSILEDLLGSSQEDNASILLELVSADFDNSSIPLKFSQLHIKSIDQVKTQIAMARDEKINSGNPACLHVSRSCIVIGTFHGHILLFDCEHKLKSFFKNEATFGSVTSLSINHDETRLICGGSKGLVALWNLTSGELLRTISDVHAPFSSAIHLEYLSDPNYAVLGDTSGSVFLLDTRKKEFDSKCVFTGSRGEVLSLKPLIVRDIESFPDYAGIEDFCITAMATISKILVISIKPNLVVYFTHTLDGDHEFLPFLSWNFEFRTKNRHKPLLAFGRKDYIHIAKMVTDFKEKINFDLIYRFKTTDYNFQHACWFQRKFLVIADVQENLHLVNVSNEEEIESLDISHVQLVYESSNYKSLANGGYVSRAMAKAGEHACSNSFALEHQQTKLYILGLKSLFEVTLRSWQERIEFYNDRRDYICVYHLLREYIRTDQTSQQIMQQFRETFDDFVDYLLANNFLRMTDEKSVRKILNLVLNYYFALHFPSEKLFDLFEKLAPNKMITNVFIEYLEHYIFENRIDALNPTLVKQITEHYIDKGWHNLLDSILINLSITSLDIDHIIKISLKHNLYDSYIYIYNCAFQDFTAPFSVLASILAEKINGKQQFCDDDVLLGNKLLVYLNCMLTCIYYPNKGRIEIDKQKAHLVDVYRFLISKNHDGEAENIKILLKYDCAEFLNVLLIAFDFIDAHHSDLSNWKQSVVDLLIAQFIQSPKIDYSNEQKTAFYIFLARCLLFSESLYVTQRILDNIVNFLLTSEARRFDERQQLLIQMLDVPRLNCDENVFLDRSEASGMFQVCEHILIKRKDWIGLFKIYLKDPFKSKTIFDYINSIFSQDTLIQNTSYREHFLQVIFENFLPLMKASGNQAVEFFCLHYNDDPQLLQHLLAILKAEELYLCSFLKLLLYESRLDSSRKMKLFPFCYESKYQELLIELACKHEEDIVADMLQVMTEYNDLNALQSCNQHHNIYGEAFLYAKVKNYDKSFKILFTDFKQNIHDIIESGLASIEHINYKKQNLDRIVLKFEKIIDFCNRHSSFRDKEKEKYCIQLLECLIDTKIHANNILKLTDTHYLASFGQIFEDGNNKMILHDFIAELNATLKCLFEKLIHSMLTHLNLVVCFDIILNRVLQHKEDVYDIREILLCILENYNYEKTLLGLTNNILLCEQFDLIDQYKLGSSRSRNNTQLTCGLCSSSGKIHEETFFIFNCSHVFHSKCLQAFMEVKDARCPRCDHLIDLNCLEVFKPIHPLDDDGGEASPKHHEPPNFDSSQVRALKYLHTNRLKY